MFSLSSTGDKNSCLRVKGLAGPIFALALASFSSLSIAEPIAPESLDAPQEQVGTDPMTPVVDGVMLENLYFQQPYTIVVGKVADSPSTPLLGNEFLAGRPSGSEYTSSSRPNSALVRVGIQRSTLQSSYANSALLIEKTLEIIRQSFSDDRTDIRVLSRGDLAQAVKSRDVDFVLGEPDFVVQLSAGRSLRPIASALPPEASDPGQAASAVFFTNADSLEIQSLDQVATVPVAALSPDSFPGYFVPLYDLSKQGYQSGYLQRLYFTNGSSEAVVEDVLSGRASVGILPACVLEAYERQGKYKLESFRVINPKPQSALRCQHSTDVFPSFVIASIATLGNSMDKTLAAVLYGIPKDEMAGEWTLPASFTSVVDVFYRLRIGPYQYLSQWSFQRFLRENAGGVAVAAVLLLMILSYMAILQMTVRKRTDDLERALEERVVIEKEVADSRSRIAALERVSIMGQMSSMIAHELKQPLGAINNFSNGLIRRLRHGRADPEVLVETLKEIVGQGTRAAEIVDKVRSYAKHPAPVMQVRDMRQVLEKSLAEFKRIYPSAPLIDLRCYALSWAEVDYLEMQLAVINLLKNATEALQGCPNPRIRIALRVDPEDDRKWLLSVEDNGREISQEKADLFLEPLNSGKMSGLGLGLSIVADIAERHKGHLRAGPNKALGHGCVMTIVLPRPEAYPVIGL